jgi:hypothetical protein
MSKWIWKITKQKTETNPFTSEGRLNVSAFNKQTLPKINKISDKH